MKKIIIAIFILSISKVYAVIPDYNPPQILARANIRDGYNLPAMSFINNSSPVINDMGEVTFKVAGIEGTSTQGIWVKTNQDENGKILYTAPTDRYVTDPSINDQAKIAFNLYEENITDGLFILDAKNLQVDNVLPSSDLHLLNFTYPQITQNDTIFFRGTDENNSRSLFLFDSELRNIYSEGDHTSYIFRPSINDEGIIVFKARLGRSGEIDENAPDQIIMLKDNVKTIIAEDKDSNTSSDYLGFSNWVSISLRGLVAFTAIVEKNQRAIYIYEEGASRLIAIEGRDNIREIENFPIKINDNGNVVFRAKDIDGKRAIYLADGISLKRVIGEGDELESDLGTSQIILNQFYPGFGGEVDINNEDEIVFNCSLIHTKDNRELGQAIYKLSVKK